MENFGVNFKTFWRKFGENLEELYAIFTKIWGNLRWLLGKLKRNYEAVLKIIWGIDRNFPVNFEEFGRKFGRAGCKFSDNSMKF